LLDLIFGKAVRLLQQYVDVRRMLHCLDSNGVFKGQGVISDEVGIAHIRNVQKLGLNSAESRLDKRLDNIEMDIGELHIDSIAQKVSIAFTISVACYVCTATLLPLPLSPSQNHRDL
jgi:hypothetical protein